MSLRYEFDYLCSDAISHNARVFANSIAVVCGEERLTWRELDTRTNQVANAIRALGFDKGDKIALFMPNSLALFELFWGVVKAGCVVVCLNTMLEGSALARITNSSDAQAMFAGGSARTLVDEVRDRLEGIAPEHFYSVDSPGEGWTSAQTLFCAAPSTPPQVSILPSDSMTIIYSSGTTGVPKGIEHTHFGRLNYPHGFAMGLAINRYSVAICATPIYASGTWITMFPTMYRGGTVVLLPQYSPEAFIDAVQRERGTHSFLVPTQYIGLLQQPLQNYDLSSLKALVTAGQSLLPATYAALLRAFPHAGIYEVYGMTEGFSTLAIPEDVARGKVGSVGKPSFLDDVRIIDEQGRELPPGETGEIVAYGPGMMKGYYNRPDMTEAATWISPAGRTYMRSGDLGQLDEDGFLYVNGRLKDMIKSGGINVYAADLEQVVIEHPAVHEVAVIGVPHEKWSETPVAVVLLKTGASAEPEALMRWVNERLSKYQRLSRVLIREELPRAIYGKVQKQVLREQVLVLLGSGTSEKVEPQ
ncbi:class I adenylate-forming enzyme family protein [Paraburkholderia xenovorans]